MLLHLTFTNLIRFFLLQLGSDEVHMKESQLAFALVRVEVCTLCHKLLEARGNTVQDTVDEVMVHYLSITIVSIDIILVLLDTTCLLEITDLAKGPVWLIVVAIVFSNSVFNVFSGIKHMPVSFLPFQCFLFSI